jgi:hypothetical protein
MLSVPFNCKGKGRAEIDIPQTILYAILPTLTSARCFAKILD